SGDDRRGVGQLAARRRVLLDSGQAIEDADGAAPVLGGGVKIEELVKERSRARPHLERLDEGALGLRRIVELAGAQVADLLQQADLVVLRGAAQPGAPGLDGAAPVAAVARQVGALEERRAVAGIEIERLSECLVGGAEVTAGARADADLVPDLDDLRR